MVATVGSGVATVHGLPGVRADELVRFAGGEQGLALDLRRDDVGVVRARPEPRDRRGRRGRAHRPRARRARGRRAARPRRRRRWGARSTAAGAVAADARWPVERPRAADLRPRGGPDPAADRGEGGRRAVPDRPRPTRADRRRPPDGQDDAGAHRGAGAAPRRRALRRVRHRPARRRHRALARGAARTRGARADRGGRRRERRRPRAPLRRPVRRDQHRRGVDGGGPRRAAGARRPDPARARLPRAVAAAAPPARPRGLPGRRLLPARAARWSGPPTCATAVRSPSCRSSRRRRRTCRPTSPPT